MIRFVHAQVGLTILALTLPLGILRGQIIPDQSSELVKQVQSDAMRLLIARTDGDQMATYARNLLDQHPPGTLSIADLAFELGFVAMPRAGRDVSVRWEGFIVAPRTGQYIFSTTPIDLNYSLPDDSYRVVRRFKLRIDDNEILDAGPDQWNHRSEPVDLTAGQVVPIQVDYHAEEISKSKPYVAQLFWEGPELELELVPASAFTLPDRSGPGLLGQYESEEPRSGVFKSLYQGAWEQVDSRLDMISYFGQVLGMRNPDQVHLAAEEFWPRATATSELIQLDPVSGTPNPLIQTDPRLLEFYSPERHVELAGRLLGAFRPGQGGQDQPQLAITALPWEDIHDLYIALRFNAPEESMQLIGAWMEANPFDVPEAQAITLEDLPWEQWRTSAVLLAFQYPPHLQKIKDEYLIANDGSCRLPAAYILNYAALMTGEIEQQIEFLDLQVNGTVGDAKATWLLARGQAEEIRGGPATRSRQHQPRLSGGISFAETAVSTATSDEVKSRVSRWHISRLIRTRQLAAAQAELAESRQAFPEDLTQAVDALVASDSQRRSADRDAARQVRLKNLQARKAAAEARSDSVAADRFQSLIDNLEEQ